MRVTLPLSRRDIHLEDIAHGLALTNRFGGQTRSPYAYAQHAYLAARLAPKDHRLAALLHHAPIAYLGEVTLLADNAYVAETVRDVREAIYNRFGIKYANAAILDEIEARLCATEARDLLLGTPIDAWHLRLGEPYEERVTPMQWTVAKQRFLLAFTRLTGGRYTRP